MKPTLKHPLISLALSACLLSTTPTEAAHTMHEDAEATVVILMFDGVQIIDFAAPYEVFGQARFNVYTVSADGGPVTTAMGLKVDVDASLADAPEADIVVVPGGNVQAAQGDAQTIAWLQNRGESASQVLSVCNGSFILGEAGLLAGASATTFHRLFDAFEEENPDVQLVRDQRWVDNGRVVTSAGLSSGIDASLHTVAEVLGERRARSIALHLEYDWSPDPSAEHGFVRGTMADRHIRMPEQDFRFPEGTVVDTVLKLGDTEHWEIEYEVDSPWGPEELLAHLAAVASEDPALEVLAGDSGLATGWRYESVHGGRWELRYEAEPAPAGESYRVIARLSPAG